MRRTFAPTFAAVALSLVALAFPSSASASPYVEAIPAAASAAPTVEKTDGLTKKTAKGLTLAQCNKVVAQGVVYHPAGWKFSCSATRVGKGVNAWTYKHETVIKPGMTLAKTKAVLAHEESHIWSLTHLTPAQMTWFSKQIGKKSFVDGTSITMPAEVWAASQAACAGYPQGPYKRVSCSLLAETLKH